MTSELDRDILVTAPPDAGGVRIDRFLATALEDNAALDAPLSRTRIKALIDAESPKKILSDDKLVEMLQGEGIDIARRTVAKYREAMRIPSSVQRRREKAIHL